MSSLLQYKEKAFRKFTMLCEFIDEQHAIFGYLDRSGAGAYASDILRSEVVFVVSALDSYIHESIISICLFNIEFRKSIDIFQTASYSILDPILDPSLVYSSKLNLIEGDLRSRLKKDSFQSSDSIGSALGKCGVKSIWIKVQSITGKRPETIKNEIDVVVTRRNSIAHEGDLNEYGQRRTIVSSDVEDAKNNIKSIVKAVDQIIGSEIFV